MGILAPAPPVSGIIAMIEAIIRQRKRPRIPQPHHDILKLWQETVLPGPLSLGDGGPLRRRALQGL